MSNERYGKLVTDEQYIYRVVVEACQDKIDSVRAAAEESEDCYCADGMKDIILDYLDELEIYPDDIDKVMFELDF